MIHLIHKWTAIPARVDRPELLDLHSGSADEVRRSLDEVTRINRWLGGSSALRRFLYPRLQARAGGRPARILDVGSGSAALPLQIARWARRRKINVRIVGLDCNERHLAIAREAASRYPEVQLVQADARLLPFAARSFDFILSTLFLHHFDPETLREMIPSLAAACGGTVILNDLIRDHVPSIFFQVTSPLFARSYLTRHDGRASIFRAYTLPEMRAILDEAGFPKARIHTHGLYYRMTVVIERGAA